MLTLLKESTSEIRHTVHLFRIWTAVVAALCNGWPINFTNKFRNSEHPPGCIHFDARGCSKDLEFLADSEGLLWMSLGMRVPEAGTKKNPRNQENWFRGKVSAPAGRPTAHHLEVHPEPKTKHA